MFTILQQLVVPMNRRKFNSKSVLSVLVTLLSLLIITQVVLASTQVNLCLTALGPGQNVAGTLGGVDKNVGAYVLKLTTDGLEQLGYCTDISNSISYSCYANSIVGVADPQVACTVKNYPAELTLSTAEAAARQSAVWFFSDGFIVKTTDAVYTRTQAIIADINAKAASGDCEPTPPPSMSITPSSATNFLVPIAGGGYEYSPHDFTIKLLQGSEPIVGKSIHVVTSAGVFDPSGLIAIDVITDSNGEAVVTVKNDAISTATITATVSVTLPAGTRIDPGATIQKLIVNGSTAFPLKATATKDWVTGSKLIIKKFQDTNRNQLKESSEPWLQWNIYYREHQANQTLPPTGWSSGLTSSSTGTLTVGVDPSKTYDICENTYEIGDLSLIDWEATTVECYWNVTPGESVSWFGNVRKPAIYIYKYLDNNGNGIQDIGEPGADGWEYQIDRWDRDDNGVWKWMPTYSGQTSDGGYLGFSYVRSTNKAGGNLLYRITEIVSGEWSLSGPTPNFVQFTVTDQEIYVFTFGNTRPGKLIVDKHWSINSLEVDPPANPASVCIKRTSAVNPLNTLVPQDGLGNPLSADAQGYYCQDILGQATFQNLWPGVYSVNETSPAGWSGEINIGDQTIVSGQTTNLSITNIRDLGYLKISKVFNALDSGFTGTFAIKYNCGAGDVTVNLAADASTTVGPIPTGTSCTVTEPVLPTAPSGWTFGTPVIAGSPAIIVKGDQAAAVAVTVTNSITRDLGYLKISKVFNALNSGFTGTFAIKYNCGAGDVTVNLAADASTTVGPFPTGTSCTVTEPVLPTAPSGWTFGTPVIAGSPAIIVKGDQAAAVAVTVTNSITRDLGYLKISKVFNALNSGFTGTFAIKYNCGAGDVTVNLAADASTTVGPFPTGTSCTVTEPVLPTPPSGWTFGTPVIVGSPAIIVKGDQAAAVAVTVTNSITRDLGYLKISKVFNALNSGFTGTFAIKYNCGAGDVTVNLAADASTTVGPFPTGTSCTVTEPVLPTPPSGWTFGTPVIVGSPAIIVKGDQAAAVAVTVTNSITRDLGYLKISKVFNALNSGFTGTFAIKYNCGAGDVTVNLAADASTTVGPFPTGTSCTVTEPVLPTAPSGWTFGTPVIAGSPAIIVKGDQAAAVAVTVTNSITRDLGYLKISKVFNALDSGFTGTFAIKYNCGAGDVTVNLAADASTTVGPFPTGTSCTVTEPVLPTAPSGWTFGTPVIAGSPAIIVKGDQAAAVAVTVTNSITRDLGYLKISKVFNALNSGFTGTFAIKYNCGAGDVTVNLAADASTTVGPIPTGTSCTVTEPVLPTAPSGWTFGTPVIAGSPAIIVKGDQAAAVAVTVTNSIIGDPAKIIVDKVTLPSGSLEDFEFNPSWSDLNFMLKDGSDPYEVVLGTGNYNVAELSNVGWRLVSAVCVSSIQGKQQLPSAIELANGEIVTCTFTNEQLGSLEVTKIVDWAMAIYEPEKIFTICVQGPTFPLGTEDGACKTVGADGGVLLWENLLPGLYTVIEENPGGEWMVIYVGTPAEVVAGGLAQASITNKNTAITAVTLKYFVKEWVIGMEAKLAWATVVEVDNLGFEIYRSDSNDFQTAEKIGFVASQVQTGDGRIYGFLDSSAPVQGQYYYWLVDISNSGQESVEGDPLNGLSVRLYASVYFLPGVSK